MLLMRWVALMCPGRAPCFCGTDTLPTSSIVQIELNEGRHEKNIGKAEDWR